MPTPPAPSVRRLALEIERVSAAVTALSRSPRAEHTSVLVRGRHTTIPEAVTMSQDAAERSEQLERDLAEARDALDAAMVALETKLDDARGLVDEAREKLGEAEARIEDAFGEIDQVKEDASGARAAAEAAQTRADSADQRALEAIGIAEGKGTIYRQPEPPVPVDPAGMWIDTDDGNRPYAASGGRQQHPFDSEPLPFTSGKFLERFTLADGEGRTGAAVRHAAISSHDTALLGVELDAEAGYTVETWLRIGSGSPILGGLALMMNAAGTAGVQVCIDSRAGSGGSAPLQIRRNFSSTVLATSAWTGPGPTPGDWYRVRADVAGDDLTATVYDATGAVRATASTSTTGAAAGGRLGLYGYGDITFDDLIVDAPAAWVEVRDQSIIDAANAAGAALAEAEAAHQAAGDARSHADAAMTRAGEAEDAAKAHADQLPKVLHGTTAPTGTAPNGSIWWRHQGSLSGPVIGQWIRTNGSWVSTPLASEAIANLDVGKLTAGAAEIAEIVAIAIAAATGRFLELDVAQLVASSAAIAEGVIDKLWSDVVVARLAIAEKIIAGEAIIDGAVKARHITVDEAFIAKLFVSDLLVDALRGRTVVGLNLRSESETDARWTEIRGGDINFGSGSLRGARIRSAGSNGVRIESGGGTFGTHLEMASVVTIRAALTSALALSVPGFASIGRLQARDLERPDGTPWIYPDTGWIPLTPENGWTADASVTWPPEIRRIGDIVHYRGRLSGGSDLGGARAATLPSWARPSRDLTMPIFASNGRFTETAWLRVQPNGAFVLNAWLGGQAYASWPVG